LRVLRRRRVRRPKKRQPSPLKEQLASELKSNLWMQALEKSSSVASKGWLSLRTALCASLLALGLYGCESKGKRQAELRAAHMAGQMQAMARAQQAREPSVIIVGAVRNPQLAWNEELTVAKAIVEAEYYGLHDPTAIVVLRAGKEIRINPKRLLAGEDMALEAGDTLEIRQ
jgi:hypothetical protein